MDCREARELLEEYRRRELPAEAAGLVEAHLRACRDCPRMLEAVESLAGMIRTLPRTPAPASLVRSVRGLARPRRGVRTWLARPWVAATVSAVLVVLALSPWLRFERERPDLIEALLQSGVAEHRRIVVLAEGTRDVDDASPLFREVERLTGIVLPPIFAGVGELHLRDARATVLAGRKSAAAALRYPKSPITTYFVLHGADIQIPNDRRVSIADYKPYVRQMNGYNIILWKQQDLAYLMVSGLDKEGCQKLFLKMRKAL
jgi:putative zinc finger protein